MRLREEDAEIFELAGEKGDAYSGEAFRQELRSNLEPSSPLREDIESLPWGSGSGMAREGAETGFVFCARVGDHLMAQFRYVSYGGDRPEVTSDTLTCLYHAQANPLTERALDEETHRLAYDAWGRARTSIFEDWQEATDPRNLQPQVPKAMREAAEVLRNHTPTGLSQSDVEDLIDAVEAPYGARIVRGFRRILNEAEDPQQATEKIAAEARELGLEPSTPPKPLPVIEMADVHLVCWMAVVSSYNVPSAST